MERQDQFAEMLSQGLEISIIRQRMGLSRGAAQGMMTRIRDNLGAQAI